MNLVQITEQLKNPAVSVQQLMQYANNSNPQVPSYVALAEMQRRQSMQAPPQAPQETVKDQLGASLMGLPSVAPSFNAAPQQPPQLPQQPQPPQQPPMQQQPPMPAPRQAMPQQPGMAGGGLTSIPLDMSHDFAAGGIIAFADGGYPEELALRKEKSIDEVRQEREAEEAKRGIVADPYVEAKRRYAELEARQKAAEKTAGADRFWAGLASYAGSGTKQFGESMGQALKTSQDLGEKQKALSEANSLKMAELQTAFAEKEDARRRGDLAADRAAQDKIVSLNRELLGIRNQFTSAQASKEQAGASARQAATQASKEQFEQSNYPREMKLKELVAAAQLEHARKPNEFEMRAKLAKEDPALYAKMFGEKQPNTSREEAIKNLDTRMGFKFKMLPLDQQEALIRQEMGGGAPAPSKPAGAPAVGTIQGGYRFKGGDPGSQSSWEKV